MKILDHPYLEPGLPVEQQTLRTNGTQLLQHIISVSSFLLDSSKLIGFADNGISAIVAFVRSDNHTYAVKIKPGQQDSDSIYNFLSRNQYKHSIQSFEEYSITFEGIMCSVNVFEYIDTQRASHIELTDNEIRIIMKQAAIALADLHKFETEGYGEIAKYDNKVQGRDKYIEDTLKEMFEDQELFTTFANNSSVLCHHALGLHNTFFTNKRLILFDFKPLLLPLEFDLAMFIIWNIYRGKEYIDIFLETYQSNSRFEEKKLYTALYLEYGRKLVTWKNRLAHNPKVKDWITNGEKERSKFNF